MRVLGSAVLSMEFLIMGFAMLLAKDSGEPLTLIYGAVVMFLMIYAQEALRLDLRFDSSDRNGCI